MYPHRALNQAWEAEAEELVVEVEEMLAEEETMVAPLQVGAGQR